ncbi:hypothetical protein HRbin06_00068 [archaeon HR06]|nr:hypothetical protein HRbin06_00068 [archaeon HR06]
MSTKREVAPPFWKIPRKIKVFTITPSPGPHPKEMCYALGVLIRDVLKLTSNMRETKAVFKDGKILVDGVVRKDVKFPVGLMDVIEIPAINKIYRLVPQKNNPLYPLEISENEKRLKICYVKTKQTIKGNKIQLGLHDGRTLIYDSNIKVGDSLLIEVPSQKVLNHLKLDKGSLALVIKGKWCGYMGKIVDLIKGSFSSPPMVSLDIMGKIVTLRKDSIMVIGKEKPLITLN